VLGHCAKYAGDAQALASVVVLVYAKAKFDNLSAEFLLKLKGRFDDKT